MTPRSDFSLDQLEMRLAPDEIIVDSFAGGGGASLGIQWALGHGPHIAINHDQEAIALAAAIIRANLMGATFAPQREVA